MYGLHFNVVLNKLFDQDKKKSIILLNLVSKQAPNLI